MSVKSRRPKLRRRPRDVTKKELYRLYRTEGLSDGAIAELFGCSRRRIGQLRAEMGIRSRSQSTAASLAMKKGRRSPSQTPESRRKTLLRAQKAYRKANPELLKARHRLQYAIKVGKVERPKKPSCEHKKARPWAYIADLERPLEPEWLCRPCLMEKRGER